MFHFRGCFEAPNKEQPYLARCLLGHLVDPPSVSGRQFVVPKALAVPHMVACTGTGHLCQHNEGSKHENSIKI